MSTLSNLGNTIKQNWFNISIVIFLLVIVLYFSWYYYNYVSSLKKIYLDESETGSGKQAELILFYANWCPHCKTAKPQWDAIKEKYQNKTVHGYKLVFSEVDCSVENANTENLMNKYNVEGFPTVKLLKDGQIIDFDAKPTEESLEQFINTAI